MLLSIREEGSKASGLLERIYNEKAEGSVNAELNGREGEV